MSNTSRTPSNSEIECVIFDLGGVLIELDGPPASPSSSELSEEQIWRNWMMSPAVRAYESGRSHKQDFAEALVKELKLDTSPEDFLTYFEQWPIGFYQESHETVESLKPKVQLGCLSNTNELHWDRFGSQSPICELFDHRFLSFEMGLMKPDPEIYRISEQKLGIPGSRILFLDDNQMNVDAARAFGWQAETTKGPREVGRCLTKHGLL